MTVKYSPLEQLPNELLIMIARHITRADDLRDFRLASNHLADIGKFEIRDRLKKNKIISPRSTTNDYDPRPFVNKVFELYEFFPLCTLVHLTFLNIAPRHKEEGCDMELSTFFLPNLQKLWLQNLTLLSNRPVIDVLRNHAGNLKQVKIIMSEIVRPLAGRHERGNILYSEYSWNAVLKDLDDKPFSVESLELNNVHICATSCGLCSCLDIPRAGDHSKILEVYSARAHRTAERPTRTVADSGGVIDQWTGVDCFGDMLEDIMSPYQWYLRHGTELWQSTVIG